MSNIIKFPRASKRKKITDVLVDRLTDVHNHVDLGHVPFTCAECDQTITFDFTHAIFKNVSFYCAGCGHGYRMTNPMFSTVPRIVKNLIK
jgi:hypothetical protein